MIEAENNENTSKGGHYTGDVVTFSPVLTRWISDMSSFSEGKDKLGMFFPKRSLPGVFLLAGIIAGKIAEGAKCRIDTDRFHGWRHLEDHTG